MGINFKPIKKIAMSRVMSFSPYNHSSPSSNSLEWMSLTFNYKKLEEGKSYYVTVTKRGKIVERNEDLKPLRFVTIDRESVVEGLQFTPQEVQKGDGWAVFKNSEGEKEYFRLTNLRTLFAKVDQKGGRRSTRKTRKAKRSSRKNH
jgi:hypothetical protein